MLLAAEILGAGKMKTDFWYYVVFGALILIVGYAVRDWWPF